MLLIEIPMNTQKCLSPESDSLVFQVYFTKRSVFGNKQLSLWHVTHVLPYVTKANRGPPLDAAVGGRLKTSGNTFNKKLLILFKYLALLKGLLGNISPNSVSTLWGSYGSGKGLVLFEVSFCCSSFRLRRLAQSSFVMAVCGRSPVAGFWVVLSDVCTLFEAKRGFT